MASVTGNMEEAIRETSRVLAVRGEILPSTLANVTLGARLADGSTLRGESAIPKAESSIEDVFIEPAGAPANPEAVRALIDRHVADAGIRVQTVMELRSIESIKQMVAQGIGAAFVSRFALARSEHSLVCSEGPLLRELAIVTRRDRTPSAAARAFLELMRVSRPGGRALLPKRSVGKRGS